MTPLNSSASVRTILYGTRSDRATSRDRAWGLRGLGGIAFDSFACLASAAAVNVKYVSIRVFTSLSRRKPFGRLALTSDA